MAANRANAAARIEPEPQDQPRSWTTAVPYDLLDQDDDMFHQPATGRAAAASAPTTKLRAVPTRAAAAPASRARTAPRPAEVTETWVSPAAPAAKTGRLPQAGPMANPFQNASTMRMVMLGAGLLVAVVALYVVVSTVVHWTQVTMDDLAYGRPRTTHMASVVGHNDSTEQPTNFIGLNLNRQVTVFEIPGGDTSKATVINGPYLFGEGEDLTPVHLAVQDVNGDAKPDLVVSVKDEQIVYINDKGSFRAMNADEKAKLEQPAIGGGPATAPQK